MTTDQLMQRLDALERSKRIRADSAQVRREIMAGLLTIEQALDDPRAGVLTVQRLLSARPAWGPRKTQILLDGMNISPVRRVRDLTDRQRWQIAGTLER